MVRPDAPRGQTPSWREWCTRDPLAAIGAMSPAGKRYVHSQDHPLNADDVVGLLEHLRREVPGRMGLIWEGAPSHRRQVLPKFLTSAAAQRLHRERLPADAPALNPGEELWQQLNGVELRNLGCCNISPLRHA